MKKVSDRILIVDDEQIICKMLSDLMRGEGLSALVAHNGDIALQKIRLESPDVMLVDFKMPGMDGIELLKRAKAIDEDLPVIMITAYANLEGAVEAIKKGAHDYFAKPLNHDEVIRVVHRALKERKLKQKRKILSSQIQEQGSLRELMGPSDAISRVIYEVNRVAKSDFIVVIVGETGSGKELIAQAIHNASHRLKAPFVPVDCGAIPETLLESELFGHEKGAYTGAVAQKVGKFETAHGGTLFLDEIANMPQSSQAKILRALQDKKIYRVGNSKPVKVDVRIIAASNVDLKTLTDSGLFRSDLFFRLNEFNIFLPSLRERKDDILYLTKRFIDITNVELNKNVKGLTESAIEALLAYHWPGNVRQLRSIIRRALLLAGDVITEKDLCLKNSPDLVPNSKVQETPLGRYSLKEIVRQNTIAVEREVLMKILRKTGGNKAKAARLLQIDYKTIHSKVKQYGITINVGENYG